MNIILRTSCLLILLSMHTETHSMHPLGAYYNRVRSTVQNGAFKTASSIAATATTAILCYYFLLPAATQTASNIGTAVVHETARVAEVAVEQTAPFGAGGYLIHFLMDEFGVESHQGMKRAYAASLALYLLKKAFLHPLGF